MPEMDWAQAVSRLGTAAFKCARSITDRVVFWPAACWLLVRTKSSTILWPSSTVGMEVFLPRAVSQSV